MQVVIILLMKNHIEDTFFQEKKTKNYNIEIDERNFYDQPINDSIKQHDEVRKTSTGKGDDYTTGCLLDFAYFKKNYKIMAADLSKQKALHMLIQEQYNKLFLLDIPMLKLESPASSSNQKKQY